MVSSRRTFCQGSRKSLNIYFEISLKAKGRAGKKRKKLMIRQSLRSVTQNMLKSRSILSRRSKDRSLARLMVSKVAILPCEPGLKIFHLSAVNQGASLSIFSLFIRALKNLVNIQSYSSSLCNPSMQNLNNGRRFLKGSQVVKSGTVVTEKRGMMFASLLQ